MLVKARTSGAWTFREGAWMKDDACSQGSAKTSPRPARRRCGHAACAISTVTDDDELLANHSIFAWSEKEKRWKPAGFDLPDGTAVVDERGRDNGLRFVDLNADGFDDVFQSNDAGHAIYLWAKTMSR
jgi:hypothetical protein